MHSRGNQGGAKTMTRKAVCRRLLSYVVKTVDRLIYVSKLLSLPLKETAVSQPASTRLIHALAGKKPCIGGCLTEAESK